MLSIDFDFDPELASCRFFGQAVAPFASACTGTCTASLCTCTFQRRTSIGPGLPRTPTRTRPRPRPPAWSGTPCNPTPQSLGPGSHPTSRDLAQARPTGSRFPDLTLPIPIRRASRRGRSGVFELAWGEGQCSNPAFWEKLLTRFQPAKPVAGITSTPQANLPIPPLRLCASAQSSPHPVPQCFQLGFSDSL